MAAPIFNPYFDKDSRQTSDDHGGPQSNVGFNGYTSLEAQKVKNGMTFAQVIPSGPAGLRGVVVPRATSGGVPRGYNPHAVKNMRMVVDPHIGGQSTQFNVGSVTKEALAAATAAVDQQLIDDDASSYLTDETALRRFRASAIMHTVQHGSQLNVRDADPTLQDMPITPAKVREVRQQATEGTFTHVPHETQATMPPQPAPSSNGVRTVTSPLSAFGRPQVVAPQPQPPLQMHVVDTSVPAAVQVQPPRRRVMIEVQGIGAFQAAYHDIVVTESMLVLIYDVRFTDGLKFVPEAGKQLAMQIVGSSMIYLLKATGQVYQVGNNEHCLLAIEDAKDSSEG